MALQFNPPQDLINAYLNRPSPGAMASDSIEKALQMYAQQKQQKEAEIMAQHTAKVADFNAVKDFLPEAQIPGAAQAAGINIPAGAVPPTPSTGTAPSAQPPIAGTPDAQGNSIVQNVSPLVQAHAEATGFNPLSIPTSKAGLDKYAKKASLENTLATGEQNRKDKQTKDEENGPKSFDYARAFASAADAKNAADPFIKIAQAEGRSTLSKREIDDMKNAISASAQKSRAGFYDQMATAKTQQIRESLNKDARTTLSPYFQSGAGKEQVQRLNAIGRVEPLINQMLDQPGGGDPRQMRELATAFNKVLTGSGIGAESQIEGLIPKTARGKFANWQEWLSNNPSGTEQQAFIKRVADSVSREKNAIANQVKTQAESSAPTLRLLKETYPEDYQAQLDSVIKNPGLSGVQDTSQTPPNSGLVHLSTKELMDLRKKMTAHQPDGN